MKFGRLFAALVASIGLTGAASAATINTITGSQSAVGPWAVSGGWTEVLGQVVTFDSAVDVNSFTTVIRDRGVAKPFSLLVYAWDDANTRATGNLLYSADFTTQGTPNNGFAPIEMLTSGLSLDAGQFVFALEITGNGASTNNNQRRNQFRTETNSSYTGGYLVGFNNDNDRSLLTDGTSWFGGAHAPGDPSARTQLDLQFALDYTPLSAVPLPAGMPLLIAGVGAFAALRRKRR